MAVKRNPFLQNPNAAHYKSLYAVNRNTGRVEIR
jgi:hypothetical protein